MGTHNVSQPIVKDNLSLYLDPSNMLSYISGSTIWNDLSGLRNNGQIGNNPTYPLNNNGILFNGSNNYVELPTTNNIIGNNQQNITICQWIKFSDISRFYSIALKRSDGDSTLASFELNAVNGGTSSIGAINLLYRNTTNTAFNNASFNGGYNNDMWYFVSGTISPTEGRLYINGELKATSSGSILLTSNSPFRTFVGSFSTSQLFFNGSISNTMIYTKSLTQSEIIQNFNATRSKFNI